MRGIRKASDFPDGVAIDRRGQVVFNGEFAGAFACGCDWWRINRDGYCNELLAYYPAQVEKILHRYETLVNVYGEQTVRSRYDKEETIILDEFLAHGKAIHAERQRAEAAGEQPHFQPLVNPGAVSPCFIVKA